MPRAKPPAHKVDNHGAGPAGGRGPDSYVPKPRFDYKPPSLLADYKYLAIGFLLVILAASIYLFRTPRKPLTIEPPAPPPVYIDPIAEPTAPKT